MMRQMGRVLLMAMLLGCSSGGGGTDDAADGGDVAGGDVGADGVAAVCTAGETRCSQDGGVEVCLADGSAWEFAQECQDANPCTTEGCQDGACVFAPLCDDQDPCTLDICHPFTAECSHEPRAGHADCCTADADCDDGSGHTQDLCDLATGACVFQVSDPAVEFLFKLGQKGTGPGQFTNPKDLHVLADGRLLVADAGNNRVLLLAPDGTPAATITQAFDLALKAPGCVYEATDGTLYICDTGNDRLVLLDSGGTVTAVWPPHDSGVHMFEGPTDVVVSDDGTVYVADGPGEEFDTGNRIIRLNAKGQVTKEQGKTGAGDGNFDKPSGIGIASSGNLFVSDHGNLRVQVLSPALEYLAQFGQEGSEPGQLKGASDLAVTPTDDLFVVDSGNQRVQVFRTCQPDCTQRLCGDDGCGGSCGECPSFGECGSDGMCTGWVAEGEAACENKKGTEEGGCGGCAAEACVCTGEGALAPENYLEEGATSDPYCCDSEWDDWCVFEAQYVCGYHCPLPDDIEWPVLEPTFGPIMTFNQTDSGPFTSPLKVSLDPQGRVWVLDAVKAVIYAYRIYLP